MSRVAGICLFAVAVIVAAESAGARVPRTMKLRFPRVTVPAGGDTELCTLIRLPLDVPFDLASVRVRQRGVGRNFFPRHFLVYLYTGDRLGEFAAAAGQVVASRACLDLGPADRDRRQLIATGVGAGSRRTLPSGLVLPLNPVPAVPGGPPDGIGIVLDVEWVNDSPRARTASTRVVLGRAPTRSVRRPLLPILERSAELGLQVPPGSFLSTEATTAAFNAARPSEPPVLDAWGAGIVTTGEPAPSGDACVLTLSGHMHKRTRFLGIDLIGADGLPKNPPPGVPNAFEPERTHLFATPDYTDPGEASFLPDALLVRAGERLHYTCWVDNGVTTTLRFGCEESGGVPPGIAAGLPGGGPAKPCTAPGMNPAQCPPTDPAYPTRSFTGACVPANLVAGTTPDDEVCALAGYYFEPVAGAPAGAECDVARLP